MRRIALLLASLTLIPVTILVWASVFTTHTPLLRVSVLDVRQGDAIFIQSPTGTQILIDGGRDRSVLRRLPQEMSLLDRSIDVVIETHPDADHIGGLPGVFDRYRISYFLSPGVEHSTSDTLALAYALHHESGVTSMTARRGMRLDIGGSAYIDILYPDRDVTSVETNSGSIVARLVYGNTAFMLTGDAPTSVEEWLVALDGDSLASDVLKAGHHGSKTSTSASWLAVVDPEVVAISAGEGNPYGHPAPEVLERVRTGGAMILSTIDKGTIRFTSNGLAVTHN